MCMLKARNGVNQVTLHIKRQRGTDPVRIDFYRVETFWFNKNLVRVFIRKAGDFVFNTWAVTWTNPFNHTRKHWRAIQTTTDNVMGPFVGMSNVTWDLFWMIGNTAHK